VFSSSGLAPTISGGALYTVLSTGTKCAASWRGAGEGEDGLANLD